MDEVKNCIFIVIGIVVIVIMNSMTTQRSWDMERNLPDPKMPLPS